MRNKIDHVSSTPIGALFAGLDGEALRISARFRLAWYDSLIVASAIEGQCDVLYREDFQDGQQIGSVTISDPFF